MRKTLLTLTLAAFLFSCKDKTKSLPLAGQSNVVADVTYQGKYFKSVTIIRQINVSTVLDSVSKKVVIKADTIYGQIEYPIKKDSSGKFMYNASGYPITDTLHPNQMLFSKDSVKVLPEIKK